MALLLCAAIAPACAESLKDIRVLADRAPDCSSLDSIVKTVTRECKTDDEKLIALYNFCRYIYYHLAYPNERGGISALKMMNVYGWGLCGGQHSVMAAIWERAGYKWRYRGWPGHTTVEVYYGDRWHYFDTFLKFFVWMQTGAGWTVAGQQDIKANPALVTDSFVMDFARNVAYLTDDLLDCAGDKANRQALAFMVCGDDLPGVIAGCKANRDAGSPRGWASVQFDGDGYTTDVSLAPGYALDLTWDKVPGAHYFNGQPKPPAHTCGDKDYRNCPVIGPLFEPYLAKSRARSYTNGTLVFKPDLRTDAFLAGLKQADNVAVEGGALRPKDAGQPAVLVVEMACPYIVTRASGKIAGDDAKAEVSRDGKAWAAISLDDFTKEVYGAYRYAVRLTFQKPVTALELTSTVQHNAPALPYLSPGHNAITVTAANPDALGKNCLAVTYAYQPGFRNRTYESLLQEGAEVARAHGAQWQETPVVVQRILDKFPCTFEIDVPTPKGKQPVYPRMLFLRREVLAPGQEPMPTPAPPSTPKVGENETLATLPVPWLMGTAHAEPSAVKPLIAGLQDPDWNVRERAANALRELGKLGDPRAVEPLLACIEVGENSLSLPAAEALWILLGKRVAWVNSQNLLHPWNKYIPERCRTPSLEAADLLLIVGDQETAVSVHSYGYLGMPAPSITRYRYDLDVKVVEAKTGKTITSQHFSNMPDEAPKEAPYGQTAIGKPVGIGPVQRWLLPALFRGAKRP